MPAEKAKEAETAREVFVDAVKIAYFAKAFGGVKPMTPDLIDFIVNWEVESYRSKVSLAVGSGKRLEGKFVIVTGGAQALAKELLTLWPPREQIL